MTEALRLTGLCITVERQCDIFLLDTNLCTLNCWLQQSCKWGWSFRRGTSHSGPYRHRSSNPHHILRMIMYTPITSAAFGRHNHYTSQQHTLRRRSKDMNTACQSLSLTSRSGFLMKSNTQTRLPCGSLCRHAACLVQGKCRTVVAAFSAEARQTSTCLQGKGSSVGCASDLQRTALWALPLT
jgi:hypothetical protein